MEFARKLVNSLISAPRKKTKKKTQIGIFTDFYQLASWLGQGWYKPVKVINILVSQMLIILLVCERIYSAYQIK